MTDGRLRGLDGLRALAVGLVILHNYGSPPGLKSLGRFTSFPGGFVGVTLFFVLSGFLITHRLIDEVAMTGAFSFRRFLGRRARRLLPALGVALVLLVVANVRNGVSVRETLVASAAAMFYVFNLVSIRRSFENPVGGIGWGPLWSLSVEEQFYLVAPIPVVWLWRKATARMSVGIISMLTLLSAALGVALWIDGASFNRLYLATDVRAQSLLLGVALAMAWHHFPGLGRVAGRFASRFVMLGVSSLVLSALFVSGTNEQRQPTWALGPGLLVTSLVCAGLVASAVSLPHGSLPSRVLDSRLASAIGQRSYGLYLFHMPVVAIIQTVPGAWVLSLAGTFVLAWVSYRCIECPMITYRRASLGHGRSVGTSP